VKAGAKVDVQVSGAFKQFHPDLLCVLAQSLLLPSVVDRMSMEKPLAVPVEELQGDISFNLVHELL
jgi:hypothetical protein